VETVARWTFWVSCVGESSIEKEILIEKTMNNYCLTTWIVADVEKEILIEKTMNIYGANSVVCGVEREILTEKRSLLYYYAVTAIFYFFSEKVKGFLIENGSFLCWKVFVVRLIFWWHYHDWVIRMDADECPATVVKWSAHLFLMLLSAEVDF
jgi:uncharacterized membrane protein (GlpM family)